MDENVELLELRNQIFERLGKVEKNVLERFGAVDSHLATIDGKQDNIDFRLGVVDDRLAKMNGSIASTMQRVADMDLNGTHAMEARVQVALTQHTAQCPVGKALSESFSELSSDVQEERQRMTAELAGQRARREQSATFWQKFGVWMMLLAAVVSAVGTMILENAKHAGATH